MQWQMLQIYHTFSHVVASVGLDQTAIYSEYHEWRNPISRVKIHLYIPKYNFLININETARKKQQQQILFFDYFFFLWLRNGKCSIQKSQNTEWNSKYPVHHIILQKWEYMQGVTAIYISITLVYRFSNSLMLSKSFRLSISVSGKLSLSWYTCE